MSKKTKKTIIISCIATITLIFTALWFVTDYFIDYALMRTDSTETLATTMKKSSNKNRLSTTQQKVADWIVEIPTAEIETTSFDGLNLWAMSYIQQEPSDLWIIGVHGYQSSYTAIEDVAMECYNRGYNVILPDLRGHGNSEGNYFGLGFHDSLDIITWINVIISENPNAKIALYGLSMGGATVMITAGQEDLPKNVFAVIEDCGYSDAYTMVEQQINALFDLPAYPLLPITDVFVQFRIDFSLKDVSPITFLEFATVPILFIHGENDKYVFQEMQDDLYQTYQGEKEILTVSDAGHTSSRKTDYDGYYETFFAFLEKYK